MKKLFLSCCLTILLSFSFSIPTFAAGEGGGLGCGGGLGPFAEIFCTKSTDKTAAAEQAGNSLNTMISGIIGFMTIIASLWFLTQVLIGGFQWISAGGDKGLLEVARLRMLHAVIGLVIVVAAWILAGIVGKLVGLDILNPGGILQSLSLT